MAEYLDPRILAEVTEVPEGAIPDWGIAVMGFIDGDGESRYETTSYGRPTLGLLIGVLEMMKHQMMVYAMIENEREEDDDEG